MLVKLAFYRDAFDNVPKPKELEWDQLADSLLNVKAKACTRAPGPQQCKGKGCTEKLASIAWSPVDIHACGLSCSSRKPSRRKNCQPHRHHRLEENVDAVTLAVFDLDHLTRAQITAVCLRLSTYELVIHSTHNHAPERDDYCVRLVIPLSAPVPAPLWRGFLAAAVSELGLPSDPSCKDLSRIYFSPSRPSDAPSMSARQRGLPLDTDQILAVAVHQPPKVAPPELGAQQESGGAYNLDELRRCLRSVKRPESRALMEVVLTGEGLPPPGAHPELASPAWPDGFPGHNSILLRIAGVMAHALPKNTPLEAMEELLRPTLNATPTNVGVEHMATVASEMLENAKMDADASKEADDREWDAIVATLSEGLEQPAPEDRGAVQPAGSPAPAGLDRSASDPQPDGGLLGSLISPDALAALTPTPVVAADFKTLLRWKVNAQGIRTGLRPTGSNAALILEHAPEWRGVIRKNALRNQVELWPSPLCPFSKAVPVPLTDSLVTEIVNWLARSDWDLDVETTKVGAQIYAIAERHSYEPVGDYIAALEWDGVPRIDTWLQDFMGARIVSADGKSIERYVRAVSAKWLMGAVARVLHPGCKMDNVLVVEGAQGALKSTALRILGGAWFSDTKLNVGDKDGRMAASVTWIHELQEKSAISDQHEDTLKGWFSQSTDDYRPPYGRHIVQVPRRCVYAVTLNPDEGGEGYLKDVTGNRRYWVVRCDGKVNTAALALIRDQLWAEAAVRLRETWADDSAPPPVEAYLYWLTPDEEPEHRGETEDRMMESGAELATQMIRAWEQRGRPAWVESGTLAMEWLSVPPDRTSPALFKRIRGAMLAAGFVDFRRRTQAGRPRGYAPGPELLATSEPHPGPQGIAQISALIGVPMQA